LLLNEGEELVAVLKLSHATGDSGNMGVRGGRRLGPARGNTRHRRRKKKTSGHMNQTAPRFSLFLRTNSIFSLKNEPEGGSAWESGKPAFGFPRFPQPVIATGLPFSLRAPPVVPVGEEFALGGLHFGGGVCIRLRCGHATG
jgi:hypothetical protein